MKKVGIVLGIIALCIVGLFGMLLLDDEDENEIVYVGNSGDDTYTLMVYICGADLESEDGSASTDIGEMLSATVDSKVNLLIETGGANEWQDYNISNKYKQIYKIENNKLIHKDDVTDSKNMTDPENLANFIEYCSNNYPADRYSLILWDHGGGSISGFGYDEHAEDEEETITIDELKNVIENSRLNYEFVGFDACLMANIETAYSLKNNVKYLIASEETEPGTGWEYKSIINSLSNNTSSNTTELGKVIVDRFIKDNDGFLDFDDATLSIVDLSKIDSVYEALLDYVYEIKTEQLDTNNFVSLSKAISESKSYAEGEIDMYDLVNLAETVKNDKSDNLINKINDAVVYYKNTSLVENSNGLSIYWPYTDLSYYDQMLQIYHNIGIDRNYTNVLTQFTNYLAGGKKKDYTINSHTYSTDENYEQYSWFDGDYINTLDDYYEETDYDSSDLEIKEDGDRYILELSDEDWDLITNITCEVFYDDGEGYIDLGSDDYYETDNAGNLIVDFDGCWLSIDDYIVPYYAITNNNSKNSKGKIPAYLNDNEVNLIVVWDKDYGKIIGAEPVGLYGNTTLNSKGLTKIQKGDKIEFLFDYYDYDGEYDDCYIFQDELIVDNPDNLKVSYTEIEDGEFCFYYKITDIYNNEYYTEAVIIE